MDQDRHLSIIRTVLGRFNLNPNNNPYILKGGTALILCYGLDRFSEDIDLDAQRASAGRKQFFPLLEHLCEENGWELHQVKNNFYFQSALILYDSQGDAKPLKIELSRRARQIPLEQLLIVNGIKTYTIDHMAQLKAAAYLGRERIRDLYDLCFIWDRYRDYLSTGTVGLIRTAFMQKGLDDFDYLLATQEDDLIGAKDRSTLADRLLEMYDDLGLVRDPEQLTPVQKPQTRKNKRNQPHL